MRRAIVVGVLCTVACGGERSATKSGTTPVVATPAAVAPTRVADSAGTPSDTLETPRMPTTQERRDSAIASARREPACAKAAPDTESREFHGALPSREFFPDSFCFSLGGSLYAVTASGEGFRLTAGKEPYAFKVFVEEGFDMTFLAYRVIENRLYFLSEITDSENGGGLLQALDKNSLSALWKSPARISFNAGIPLITDSVAYMTGINEVGKVRLSDGKFIWKHLFLGDYEPLPGMLFNSFDTPVVENGLVRFTPDSATSHAPGALLVDDKTGIVVAPEILKGQKPACTGEQSYC